MKHAYYTSYFIKSQEQEPFKGIVALSLTVSLIVDVFVGTTSTKLVLCKYIYNKKTWSIRDSN